MKNFFMCLLVLVVLCLPLTILAQNPPPQVPANSPLDLTGQRQTSGAIDAGQDQDLMRLGGQIDVLNSQLAGLKSARDAVARARIGKLADRVRALEEARARLPADLVDRAEIQRMIDEAIRAAGGIQPSPGSPAGSGPSAAAATGFNFDQKLKQLENDLSARISGLKADIYALNDRLRAVEAQLQRRAVWFDVGGRSALYLGGADTGAVGALNWPLGQDGDFVARASLGAGQGWRLYSGSTRRTLGWATQVDLLYRGESTFLGIGPTAALVGQTGPAGNLLMFPAAGVAGRLGPLRLDFVAGSVSTSSHLEESRFGCGASLQFIIPLL